MQELKNPLARRPRLVISTLGLAEIITNQLYARQASKNIYRILTNLSIFVYLLICYMLFNEQQCFIYSTASFLSKLRAKKIEKL